MTSSALCVRFSLPRPHEPDVLDDPTHGDVANAALLERFFWSGRR
jgi:hypothetical protein